MKPTPIQLPSLAVAAAALLALAGCGILPEKQPLSLYAPEARVAADPAWPTVAWQLQIPRPYADELLDSPRIVVRPAPGELQVYKGAVWSQPVPDLLQAAVLRAFEDSGKIAGVARNANGVAGDYELMLDVRRFQSSYGDAAGPVAEVDVNAKLIALRSNSVVASRLFTHRSPAGGTGVAAVANALDTSLGAVTHAIVGWTLAEGQRYDAAHPRAAR